MFIIVITAIFMVGYIGYRFFYLAPENANNMREKRSILREFIGFCKRVGLGYRLWHFLKSSFVTLRHQRLLALGLVIVMVSIAVTLALGGRHWLERPSVTEIEYSAKARLAFIDEKLVPPPALPPSIFIGSDRPSLETADRDWSKLQPVFRQTLLSLLARLSARGYDFVLLEGYRSPERQESLAALGGHVTQARAYESRHQYGMAADLAPIRNGALMFNFDDAWGKAAYKEFGREAAIMGLVWGGQWKMQDYGHIEMR